MALPLKSNLGITLSSYKNHIVKSAIALILGFSYFSTFASISVGNEAPEIKLSTSKGEEITLSSLRGKIVLVDFWASWCHPCREANPLLTEAYLKYHHKGFEILSVSLDDNKSHWLQAIEQDKLPWKWHVSDLKGWDSKVIQDYNVEALPTSYLIDRNGKIVALDPFAEDLELELEEIFLKELSFYPKNASSKLYLSLATDYKILNSDGKKVLKGEGDIVDVSSLPNGVYTIDFGGKHEKFLKKESHSANVNINSMNSNVIVFSDVTKYEVHDSKGDIISDGQGIRVDVSRIDIGEYYIHFDDKIEKYIKK